jgi:DNA repair protein RecO (recombination protein O)
MAIFTDIAICLRRLDYSETSQVLSLLTREHGLVRMIAKGQKRSTRTRVSVGVDLLEMGQAVWSAGPAAAEGRLSTLREWQQREIFPNVRQDLGAVVAAQYAVELVAATLPEADPYPELFEVLCKFLGHIGRGKPNLGSLVRFVWLVLHYAGHLPQWQRCGLCGDPVQLQDPAFFGLDTGGYVCAGCAGRAGHRMKVEGRLSAALYAGRPERVPDQGFLLLDAYVTHLSGRPPRTSEAVRQALLARPAAPAQGGESPGSAGGSPGEPESQKNG